MLVQDREAEAGDERASSEVEAGVVTPPWAPSSPHKYPPSRSSSSSVTQIQVISNKK